MAPRIEVPHPQPSALPLAFFQKAAHFTPAPQEKAATPQSPFDLSLAASLNHYSFHIKTSVL